jgi:hypothetical protein
MPFHPSVCCESLFNAIHLESGNQTTPQCGSVRIRIGVKKVDRSLIQGTIGIPTENISCPCDRGKHTPSVTFLKPSSGDLWDSATRRWHRNCTDACFSGDSSILLDNNDPSGKLYSSNRLHLPRPPSRRRLISSVRTLSSWVVSTCQTSLISRRRKLLVVSRM